jgi:hypothetical protein
MGHEATEHILEDKVDDFSKNDILCVSKRSDNGKIEKEVIVKLESDLTFDVESDVYCWNEVSFPRDRDMQKTDVFDIDIRDGVFFFNFKANYSYELLGTDNENKQFRIDDPYDESYVNTEDIYT